MDAGLTCGNAVGCCGDQVCNVYRQPLAMLDCSLCSHNGGSGSAVVCRPGCPSKLVSGGREACATLGKNWPQGDRPPGLLCPRGRA